MLLSLYKCAVQYFGTRQNKRRKLTDLVVIPASRKADVVDMSK
ncbi:MAG: hypothetical protein JWP81_4025 [Ferruginibacter sp.]|nr:hypothetical protein [Ferruginibacter sp.]